MSRRFVRAIILCEDLRQANLLRGYLARAELAKRRDVLVRLPESGSGEQYVRQRYPIEVRGIRSRSYQKQLVLVTMVDADDRPVDERYSQLAEQLTSCDLRPRSLSEPIFILVPKRNVETWIWFLIGHQVNEVDDYKDRVKNEHCGQAAAALCRLRESGWALLTGHLDSLAQGCEELKRMEGQRGGR